MITKRRLAFWMLLVGGLAWLIHGAGVPLYDGLGFPDEPYRYVTPPPDVPHGPPATAASHSVPVSAGTNAQLGLQSTEQGPQISLYLPAGALTPPAGASQVTVTATPLAPEQPTPYGPIDGNIYRIAITSDAGPVVVNTQAVRDTMTLRATEQFPPDTIGVFRPTGQAAPWTRVTSGMAGFNVFSVEFRGSGDYALVQPAAASASASVAQGAKAPPPSGGRLNTVALILFIVGGFVLLVLVIAILARWRSTAASSPPPNRRQPQRKRPRG